MSNEHLSDYQPKLIEYEGEGEPYVEFVSADEPTVTRTGLSGELLLSLDHSRIVGVRVFLCSSFPQKEEVEPGDLVERLREWGGIRVCQEAAIAIEALMRERTSLIETKREQIERLTDERDAARAGEQASDEYIVLQRAALEAAERENKVLRAALVAVSDTSHRARDRKHYKFPIPIMQKVDNALRSDKEPHP